MKIIADENIPYLEGRIRNAELLTLPPSDITPDAVRDADALIVRTRTACGPQLLQDSKVRLIATATIGTDHIDKGWCAARGITVVSAPGCNAPAVAQYVWSSLLRMGFNPSKGERLGVVGCGSIGSIVTAWGRSMGAEIWVSDPPRQRAGAPEDYYPLDEILHECRAVTFHTPMTREGEDATWHLVGERELDMMRDDAILVNAARGPIVDNAALLARLEGKPSFRAVLDTWENEPEINRNLLDRTSIGTFHIAGYSRQGKERATRMALTALHNHLGLDVDLSGLEAPYILSETTCPSAEGIMLSYNPEADTELLRANPELFEKLRNNYHLREEV